MKTKTHLYKENFSISYMDRRLLNNHNGKVIWFTGLSGSGKSTLANALEIQLYNLGMHTYILDGDNVRLGLNKDLKFGVNDRIENIRRVAEVAKLMQDAGLIVITSFISPFKQEREMARQLIGENNFFEVYINTPIKICEERDPKGLYLKARNGEINNMTGIDSPYEVPDNPNYTINTNLVSIKDATENLLQILKTEGLISNI